MPKRRSDDQLERAWAARLTRPDLEKEPFKSDAAAKRAAQDDWVASWDGTALTAEARRKAWWKQSTKQHGELCKAYEREVQMYGDSSQCAFTSSSSAATAMADASASADGATPVSSVAGVTASTAIADMNMPSQSPLGSMATVAPATADATASSSILQQSEATTQPPA